MSDREAHSELLWGVRAECMSTRSTEAERILLTNSRENSAPLVNQDMLVALPGKGVSCEIRSYSSLWG